MLDVVGLGEAGALLIFSKSFFEPAWAGCRDQEEGPTPSSPRRWPQSRVRESRVGCYLVELLLGPQSLTEGLLGEQVAN